MSGWQDGDAGGLEESLRSGGRGQGQEVGGVADTRGGHVRHQRHELAEGGYRTNRAIEDWSMRFFVEETQWYLKSGNRV